MLQIDPAGIDDEVNRLFEAVQWGIDDYRQQRNELLRDGHIEELRQLARERAEQIFGDFLGELTHWLDEHGLPCDAPEMLSQLAGRLQIMPPHELFRSALDDDDALLDLREAFEQELRHCFGRRACRELIGHWDLPNRATFCDELLDTLPPNHRHNKSLLTWGCSPTVCTRPWTRASPIRPPRFVCANGCRASTAPA